MKHTSNRLHVLLPYLKVRSDWINGFLDFVHHPAFKETMKKTTLKQRLGFVLFNVSKGVVVSYAHI
jgi:hypothetical protein